MKPELAALLESTKQSKVFKLPDGYFMELSDAVQAKIAQKQTSKKAVWEILFPKPYRLALSIAVPLLIGAAGLVVLNNQKTDNTVLQEYIAAEMNEQELVELVAATNNATIAEDNMLDNASEDELLKSL